MEGFSHIWSAEMRRFLLSPVLRGTAHGLARSLARCGVARLIARPAWTAMASARVAPCFSSAGLTATARHDPVPTDQNWHVLHQGTFLDAQLAGRARRHEHDLSTPRKRAARRRMHAFHLVRAPSGHAQPEQCSRVSSSPGARKPRPPAAGRECAGSCSRAKGWLAAWRGASSEPFKPSAAHHSVMSGRGVLFVSAADQKGRTTKCG